jgi:hypothetical protein
MTAHLHTARRTRLRRLLGLAAAALLAGTLLAPAAPAQADRVTPGNFTGYGFDQCLTPTQAAMDAWRMSSPFWAVGIYISGDSRACRNQPNQTPDWVRTQHARGWRILPITLGPQASCNPRFPRYADDETINPRSARNYRAARRQGRAEANTAVAAARRLGIDGGSTLWYDMEAYDIGNVACRESALHFTSAWTDRLHRLGYVSGVYSSAASGIKAMDDARVNRPSAFSLPDQIWIARWDGVANTSTSYIRDDGWLPGGRMKQYRGGHDETHGGVTINIDSNWLDLGRGSVAGPAPEHCGGVRVSQRRYAPLNARSTGRSVVAAQCLLQKAGYYDGALNGAMDEATRVAVRDFRLDRGLTGTRVVSRATWTALLSRGDRRLVKFGGAGEQVRRLQRGLNSAVDAELRVNGVYEARTTAAVRTYQAAVDLPTTGVTTRKVWKHLQRGRL